MSCKLYDEAKSIGTVDVAVQCRQLTCPGELFSVNHLLVLASSSGWWKPKPILSACNMPGSVPWAGAQQLGADVMKMLEVYVPQGAIRFAPGGGGLQYLDQQLVDLITERVQMLGAPDGE